MFLHVFFYFCVSHRLVCRLYFYHAFTQLISRGNKPMQPNCFWSSFCNLVLQRFIYAWVTQQNNNFRQILLLALSANDSVSIPTASASQPNRWVKVSSTKHHTKHKARFKIYFSASNENIFYGQTIMAITSKLYIFLITVAFSVAQFFPGNFHLDTILKWKMVTLVLVYLEWKLIGHKDRRKESFHSVKNKSHA